MATAGVPDANTPRTCSTCQLPLRGQVVRGLDGTHHLDCFKCSDCGISVASKFFPQKLPDGTQKPLCETDYFRRLDLLCAKCGGALRGPFISAFGRKWHETHFQCSLCPKTFSKDDSIYERNGSIFCQFHYSLLYATKCGSCRTAVLRKFIEINREGLLEQWHLDCYHIYQTWSARMVPKNMIAEADANQPQTEEGLIEDQRLVQQRTARIMKVLAAFEESAANCISQTVVCCAKNNPNEGVAQAARFLVHVDSLYNGIDVVETKLAAFGDRKVLQHDKEPKELAKQLVALFTLLSTQSPDAAQTSRGKVTELARLLKYMITAGLRGAIKLDRIAHTTTGLDRFLDVLEVAIAPSPPSRPVSPGEAYRVRLPPDFPIADIKNESCAVCQQPVEEDCLKLGPLRWHGRCFSCAGCGASQAPFYSSAMIDFAKRRVYCANCARTRPGLVMGFESVSQLQQYVFLLRLGLTRLCNVFNEKGTDPGGRLTPTSLDAADAMNRRGSRKSKSISGLDQVADPSAEATTRASHRASGSISVAQQPTRQPSPRPAGEINVNQGQSGNPAQNSPALLSSSVRTPSGDVAAQLGNMNLTVDAVDGGDGSDEDRSPNSATKTPSVTAAVLPYQKKTMQVMGGRRFLSELSPLDFVALRSSLVPYLHSHLESFMSLDQIADLVEAKRNTIWDKIVSSFKGGEKKPKSKGTFAVPLQELTNTHGVLSDLNIGPNPVLIPKFIDVLIRQMRSQDLKVEGIFRKNGNIKRLKTVSEELDKDEDNMSCLLAENVIQLSALLRRFLRDMPDPLLTFDLFKVFANSQKLASEEARKKVVHYALCLLPKNNRDVLEVLLSFLRVVAEDAGHVETSAADGNKMDLDNLATVIAPCILYPKAGNGKSKEAAAAAEEAFLAIGAVKTMLKYLDELVLVPPEFEKVDSNMSETLGRDARGDVRFSTGNSAGGAIVEGVSGSFTNE